LGGIVVDVAGHYPFIASRLLKDRPDPRGNRVLQW